MSDLQLEVNELRNLLRAAEKDRDDIARQCNRLNNEKNDLRAQLSQRREFTLTAEETADHQWFVSGERNGSHGFIAYCHRKQDAKALERWSREGAKVEPEIITAPDGGRYFREPGTGIVRECEPPAPDLAAQVAFDELKAALDKWPKTRGSYFVADAIRQLIDAISSRPRN